MPRFDIKNLDLLARLPHANYYKPVLPYQLPGIITRTRPN